MAKDEMTIDSIYINNDLTTCTLWTSVELAKEIINDVYNGKIRALGERIANNDLSDETLKEMSRFCDELIGFHEEFTEKEIKKKLNDMKANEPAEAVDDADDPDDVRGVTL